jgi:RimJ/RimL family protein N-acetyltransferase
MDWFRRHQGERSGEDEMTTDAPTPQTKRVRLREVTESDLPVFFEQQWDPVANRMAAFPPRERVAFMAHWAKILSDQTAPVRTILFDGHVAGNVVSWEQDGKRLVGYWVGKDFWGQGIATAALFEFLRMVGNRPLHAYVAKHNIGSIRVLEKCGFKTCADAKHESDAPGNGVEEFLFRLDAS